MADRLKVNVVKYNQMGVLLDSQVIKCLRGGGAHIYPNENHNEFQKYEGRHLTKNASRPIPLNMSMKKHQSFKLHIFC